MFKTLGEMLQKYTADSNEETVIVPENIKIISWNAFKNCKTIKKILIPNGVEGIGANAFENCESLEEIELPQSLISIATSAFENCFNLKKIILPENIKKIERLTFSNCKNLSEIEIKSNSIKIEPLAFFKCENLVQIKMENCEKVEFTKWNTFDGCKKISTQTFSDFKNIQNIDKLEVKDSIIFSNDKLLRVYDLEIEEIDIPDFIKNAEEDVFPKNIKKMEFPKGFRINRNAYIYESKEATEIIGKQIDTMMLKDKKITDIQNTGVLGLLTALKEELELDNPDDLQFNFIKDFTAFEKDDKGKYNFESTKKTPTSLATLMRYKNRFICLELDYDTSKWQEKMLNFMKTFTNPSKKINGIAKEIEKNKIELSDKVGFTINGGSSRSATLFTKCFATDRFSYVNVNNLKVAQIDFDETLNYESTVLNWQRKHPNKLAFLHYHPNNYLKNISIASCCKIILPKTFRCSKELKEIVIPGTVKTVSTYAFTDCPNLRKVVFSEGVEKIDRDVFHDCKNLTEVHIPNSVSDFDFLYEFSFVGYLGYKRNIKFVASKEIIEKMSKIIEESKYFKDRFNVSFSIKP